MAARALHLDDLDDLVRGAHLLGCGGGGNPYYAGLRLRAALQAPVPLRSVRSLRADDQVVAIGSIGSPDLEYERLPSGQELRESLELLESCTGVRATVLVPLMIGGDIGVVTVIGAAESGLPCLDADLAGRAVPRLDLLAPAHADGFLPQLAFAWPSGLRTFLTVPDIQAAEEAVRGIVPAGGGWGAIAMPVPLDVARTHLLSGAYDRAVTLGRAVRRAEGPDALRRLAEAEALTVVAAGRVRRVVRRDRSGDAPTPTLDALLVDDLSGGGVVRLHAGTEYDTVTLDGRTRATAPDLIMVVEARSLVPVDVTALQPGQDVIALTADRHPWWAAA